jgi:hypothetical protein
VPRVLESDNIAASPPRPINDYGTVPPVPGVFSGGYNTVPSTNDNYKNIPELLTKEGIDMSVLKAEMDKIEQIWEEEDDKEQDERMELLEASLSAHPVS